MCVGGEGCYTEGLEKSLREQGLPFGVQPCREDKIEDEGVDSPFWHIIPVRYNTNAECLSTESRVTRLLVNVEAVPRSRPGKGNIAPLIVIPCQRLLLTLVAIPTINQ